MDTLSEYVCCICGKKYIGFGNNPWPVVKTVGKRCCDNCNDTYVVPERIIGIIGNNRNGENSSGRE